MSDQHRTTVTRRRALKSGGLAALAAGLMGAGTVNAEPMTALAAFTTPLSQTDAEWSAWLDRWKARAKELLNKSIEISDELAAGNTGARTRRLANDLSDVMSEIAMHDMDRDREIIVRHMPGLEPVLRLLFAHTVEMFNDELTVCAQHHCIDQVW